MQPKHVSDTMIEQVYQVRPEHLNGSGRLFGGRLMEWIDEVSGGHAPCSEQCDHRFRG